MLYCTGAGAPMPSPLGKVDFSSPSGDEKDGRGITAVRIRRRATVKWQIVLRLSRPLSKGEGFLLF